MNCKEISILISAYIDDELTTEEKELLASHIKKCGDCNTKYTRIKKTDSLFTVSKSIKTSPFFETRFLQRLKERQTVGRSILDMVVVEKKLLFVFTAFLLIISAVTIKSYLVDTTHGYTELQSYILGNSSANTNLLNKQEIEIDDIIKYITDDKL